MHTFTMHTDRCYGARWASIQ